jgi:SAM-dependent methyltransferase
MKVFRQYSTYYDQLYKTKDYVSEAAFVQKIIKKESSGTKTLISIGCGTCNHDIILAKNGYSITGIDQSQSMLDIAKEKIRKNNLMRKISLFKSDVRQLPKIREHDAAIAMFNVWGYLTDNNDVDRSLKGVSENLKSGGLLLFDCWNGAAVLTDRPGDRIKEIVDRKERLIRITRSTLETNRNVININFRVLRIKGKLVIDEIEETHQMRYWSLPELDYFLMKNGFKIISICNNFDMHSQPTDQDWNIFIIARKL